MTWWLILTLVLVFLAPLVVNRGIALHRAHDRAGLAQRIDVLERDLGLGRYAAPPIAVRAPDVELRQLPTLVGHPEYVAQAHTLGLIQTNQAIVRLQMLGYTAEGARQYLMSYDYRQTH